MSCCLPCKRELCRTGPLDYGRPYAPSAEKVAEERRLFYVALTRAQRTAVLIYSLFGEGMYAGHAF